jgi:hypothetical protein
MGTATMDSLSVALNFVFSESGIAFLGPSRSCGRLTTPTELESG